MRSPCCPNLDGTWVPVSAEVSGRELPVAELRVARFVIESETYRIVDRRSHVVDCGELRLDGAAVPCALDIIGVEGPNAGKRMHAIIELDCERRPQTMQPSGDQLLLLITYTRASPVLNA
jgi:uncharacterized protein (TIGR03067 family)